MQPVDSIDNGLLFAPIMISGNRGVQVNRSHPYYSKVYVPNLNRGVTIQGMDSLLWALAIAELTAYHDETTRHFEDLRYELSRILSRLVESPPDPEVSENAA